MSNRDYEIPINRFLSKYLGIDATCYTKEKLTHAKLREVLVAFQLEKIICGKRKVLWEEICLGDVLLVRDHTGKCASYWNPSRLQEREEFLCPVAPQSTDYYTILISKRKLLQNIEKCLYYRMYNPEEELFWEENVEILKEEIASIERAYQNSQRQEFLLTALPKPNEPKRKLKKRKYTKKEEKLYGKY